MEEIKVGDFIRIKEPYGDIYKVIGREQEDILLVDSLGNNRVETGYVSKHSPNIIDLIEEGDYINGCKVTGVWDENKEDELVQIALNNTGYYAYYSSDDIKNIVTKEQFEAIKYIVKE